MSHHYIRCNNLSFSYEYQKEVLRNLTFEVKHDDSVGIIGANGVGKSTLLKILVGLQLNFTGSVIIEDIPLSKRDLSFVRQKIGYVFQDSDSQLFTSNAYDDIAFAPRNYGLSEEEVEKRVNRALKAVNIEHLKYKHIFKMSGGEKRLVSIATILSMIPDIILMDEPSAALDPKNRRNLILLLNSFDHIKMIASHDLDFIMETCNRVILMNNGGIVKYGDTEEVLIDRELLESNGLELPLCMKGYYHK
ncbi:ABC transporter ATP-binding protein [Tissierella sp.]|uniref:energy-coupling factor ABC transporter ATP-binding protein n=1 Tax=Tissierella sp. TaxID=41274 RepID=UPI0030625B2E